MARPLRIEYPGAVYLVYNRGNAGEAIFTDGRDGEQFLAYLEAATERFHLRIYAYCLMPRHYHLLIQTPHPNLSRAIQWINVSYAAYFNSRHRRSGHLFQGRFKAYLLDPDSTLDAVSRHLHLNPVRAGIAASSRIYRWSSYAATIGARKAPEWLNTTRLLSLFGASPKKAREAYSRFVESADAKTLPDPTENAAAGVVLGPPEFIDRVRRRAGSVGAGQAAATLGRALLPRITLETVVRQVADTFDCTEQDLLEKGRKRNRPRDVAIYLSRELTGETGVRIGRHFGGITGAGVTARCQKILQDMKTDRTLAATIDRLKRRIEKNS